MSSDLQKTSPSSAQPECIVDLRSQTTPVIGCRNVTGIETGGTRAIVYFTRHIDAAHIIQLYRFVGSHIYGKTAIKLHTGEPHGPNILPPEWVRQFQEQAPDSTIIEANTIYPGGRDTTEKHRETLKTNGWTFSPVDIIDEEGSIDLPVRNGLRLKEVAMGAHLVNYDSLIVLTHFKGHYMGGFGGSMKNIAIGCASGNLGKFQVHGVADTMSRDFSKMPLKDTFMELMADSAKATCDFFGQRVCFINVLRRLSVDCDCVGTAAAEPKMPDIGICASTDILAVDQASCDLVFSRPEKEKHDLVERIMSRHGLHQLAAMRQQKMGNSQYEFVSID